MVRGYDRHLFVIIITPFPGPDDVVFAAEELRYAAQSIGRVTGDIFADDILDAVFRDFCIGK